MAKKERMSEKMYKNSPTLASDENGKKYIKKNEPTEAEKKSARVNDGTDGMPLHEVHARHQNDMFQLYQKHAKEFADMHMRHQVEAGGAGGANPAADGGELIKKVESDKKE